MGLLRRPGRINDDPDPRLADAAERKRQQNADQLQQIHARRAAEALQFDARQRREQQRDREEIERNAKDYARRQSQAEGRGLAQAAWAETRNKLQVEVDELRSLLAGAKGAVSRLPLDDARPAAADALVYEGRLEIAERALAGHMRNQPSGW